MSMLLNALVVDDEAFECNVLSGLLHKTGFSVDVAQNSDELFHSLSLKLPNVVILDAWLKGSEIDSLGIVEILSKEYPQIPIVITSDKDNIDIALNAVKLGASDYLEKPLKRHRLSILLRRVCKLALLQKENRDLKSKILDHEELIGTSVSIIKVKNQITKLAGALPRVFIQGARGSGKKLLASLIHKNSTRAHTNFISFSPIDMSDGEILHNLFGESTKSQADKNSYSLVREKSLLELADKGTLYIEDITSFSPAMQKRLLDFIQDGIIQKKDKQILLDVRIITSNTYNIESSFETNNFSRDLFYRINIVKMVLPDLKDRKDDIEMLVNHFIDRLVHASGLQYKKFAKDSLAALQSYSWPGNIRQLRNIVEWALIMNSYIDKEHVHSKILPHMLPKEVIKETTLLGEQEIDNMMYMPLRKARELFEKKYLLAQMCRFNNNISKASNFIGMERSALHRKLKTLSIHSNNKVSQNLVAPLSASG